jgi:hypothetical protein
MGVSSEGRYHGEECPAYEWGAGIAHNVVELDYERTRGLNPYH